MNFYVDLNQFKSVKIFFCQYLHTNSKLKNISMVMERYECRRCLFVVDTAAPCIAAVAGFPLVSDVVTVAGFPLVSDVVIVAGFPAIWPYLCRSLCCCFHTCCWHAF